MTRGCQPSHWPTLPWCWQSRAQPLQGQPIFATQCEGLGHRALSISPIRQRPKGHSLHHVRERVREGGNDASFQWRQGVRCTGEKQLFNILARHKSSRRLTCNPLHHEAFPRAQVPSVQFNDNDAVLFWCVPLLQPHCLNNIKVCLASFQQLMNRIFNWQLQHLSEFNY